MLLSRTNTFQKVLKTSQKRLDNTKRLLLPVLSGNNRKMLPRTRLLLNQTFSSTRKTIFYSNTSDKLFRSFSSQGKEIDEEFDPKSDKLPFNKTDFIENLENLQDQVEQLRQSPEGQLGPGEEAETAETFNERIPYFHYKVLKLDEEAGPEEIKWRFRDINKHLHPDISEELSKDQYLLVTNAYKVIGRQKSKEAYDEAEQDKEEPVFLRLKVEKKEIKIEFKTFLK